MGRRGASCTIGDLHLTCRLGVCRFYLGRVEQASLFWLRTEGNGWGQFGLPVILTCRKS